MLPYSPPRQSEACAASFSPNEKKIVTGGFDGTVQIWDADSGKELQRIVGHVKVE